MEFNLIVAVDRNWAIGKNNKLMWSIPADMKFFREKTKGNIVIMGRKTLESFPQGQPLKGRVNIVITSIALKRRRRRLRSMKETFSSLAVRAFIAPCFLIVVRRMSRG